MKPYLRKTGNTVVLLATKQPSQRLRDEAARPAPAESVPRRKKANLVRHAINPFN